MRVEQQRQQIANKIKFDMQDEDVNEEMEMEELFMITLVDHLEEVVNVIPKMIHSGSQLVRGVNLQWDKTTFMKYISYTICHWKTT